jgi:betaine-aldehyde dehydrogenase
MGAIREANGQQLSKHWIDGKWVTSETTGRSTNPSTGELLGLYSNGGRSEAEAAVVAARRAFDGGSWAQDRQLRANALTGFAEQLERRRDAIATMLSKEIGKTVADAQFEATVAPSTLRHNAGSALSQTGTSAQLSPAVYAATEREPIGVAGIIVPWNSPLALFLRALAPALAAGCTTVVKMPGQAAMTTDLIAEAISATDGFPVGVVNIFTESGNGGAPYLVSSPDVDVINYTGSTAVGREIAKQAAGTLKRVCLELGGKTPLVVFEDADIDTVAPLAVKALTMFNGEFCMTGSRLLVQRSVAPLWKERIQTLLESLNVGIATDSSSQMGPVIDHANVERLDKFVEDAKSYANVLLRGGRSKDERLKSGSFYMPSMLETERLDVPLIQQEIFGPVLSFEVFDDETEALARANATEFGLAAGVFTHNFDRARRMSRGLKAGTVWINTWGYVNDTFEEGGFKQSGLGRSRGTRAMEEFQEIKTRYESIQF